MPHVKIKPALLAGSATDHAGFRSVEIPARHGHHINNAGKGIRPPENRPGAPDNLDALHGSKGKFMIHEIERLADIRSQGNRVV